LEKLEPPSREAGPRDRSESHFERSRHRLVDFATRAQYHYSLRYSHRGSSIKVGCLVALRLRTIVVSRVAPYSLDSARLISANVIVNPKSHSWILCESVPRDYLTSGHSSLRFLHCVSTAPFVVITEILRPTSHRDELFR